MSLSRYFRAIAVATLAGGLGLAGSAAASVAGDDARRHLVFESVGDGRCQNLSDGGKLRVLRNLHPERAISFRLVRLFAGEHPQGLTTGLAPAGGEPVPLGCTLVDGRTQDWRVDKARFQ